MTRTTGIHHIMTTAALLLALSVTAATADTRVSVAAMNGDLAAVQQLLQQGAPVSDAQGDGTTALHWAAMREDLAMTQVLLKAKADVNAKARLNQMTPLFLAAKAGNAAIVDALIKAGADAKFTSSLGTTALMLGAASGNVETVKLLLQAGAPVNAADATQGQTALMFAAANGRADVIRALSAAGAALNVTSKVPNRLTREEAISTFPGARTASTSPDQQPLPGSGRNANRPLAVGGMTAMQFAAREGHMDAVKALVESGADVNVVAASDKMSTLLFAVLNGNYDMAAYLLDRGADPKPASTEQATPLFAAIDTKWAPRGWYPAPVLDEERVDYMDLMKRLLDKGADVNARMNGRMWMRIAGPGGGPVYTGDTAFLRAAQANDVDAMKFLLSRGANPYITTAGGVNALMFASGAGHRPSEGHVKPDSRVAAVRFLIDELGFDVNSRDKNGFTSLHGAASVGDKDVITLLVAHGADVAVRSDALADRTIATTTGNAMAAPGSGESIADMANGPGEKTLVYTEVVDMLVALGSPFSDNCRSSLCVNKERPDTGRVRPGTVVSPATPSTPAPAATPADPKKPAEVKKGDDVKKGAGR